MSDNKQNVTNNFALANVDIPDSVDEALKNISQPVTKNAGQTFGDIWFLVFGGISQVAEKRKMKYAANLLNFKNELDAKINEIPKEKRIEPNMQTVGPALENSKYSVESEQLRTMFANLISRSMNSDYSNYVHPAYAGILKQMSPLDAQNLALFKEKTTYPICDILVYTSDSLRSSDSFNNFFISNPKEKDSELQSQSISSLLYFGLIEIPIDVEIRDKDKYKVFYEDPFYVALSNSLSKDAMIISLDTKIVRTTPFGRAFIKSCI